MEDICSFKIRIVGDRSNRDEFIRRMTSITHNHFYCMYDIEVLAEESNYTIVSGECSWSINACCRADGYSNGIDLLAVNTKELNLIVEVWSVVKEPVYFEEHYIYDNGKCICDEETVMAKDIKYNRNQYNSFAEFKNEFCLNDNYKEEDFDADGNYTADETNFFGFSNWGEWTA